MGKINANASKKSIFIALQKSVRIVREVYKLTGHFSYQLSVISYQLSVISTDH
ncbi:MAG: hypothetical protein F6K39_01140 [Okeania sp. SIO3B3]|nr:hypothetical protein [Okeania sp. SIO3B3]